MRTECALLRLGYTCNNNCVYCSISQGRLEQALCGKRVDLSFSDVEDAFRDMESRGVARVTLTGGEPTIREDFFDILRLAKSMDFNIELETNGRMFSQRHFSKRFMEIFPEADLEISLPGITDEVHDCNTHVKGSFRQTISGIHNLIEFGAKEAHTIFVITKCNAFQISQVPYFLHELSDTISWKVGYTLPMVVGNARVNFYDIVPDIDLVKGSLASAISYSLNLGMKPDTFNIPLCWIPGFENYATEMSYLSDKGSFGYGLSQESPLRRECWHDLRLKSKAKLKSCTGCKYFCICEGVWKDYIRYYGRRAVIPIPGERIRIAGETVQP